MAITDETIQGGGVWRQIALPVGARRVVVQYGRGRAPVKLRPSNAQPAADVTAGLTLTPGSPPLDLPLRSGEGLWALCLAADSPTLHVMGCVDAISVVLDASDIELGALEIKDADTDVRAKVGSGAADAALRVTLATDGPGVLALGAPADAAVTNPQASATIVAALKGALSLLAAPAKGWTGDYEAVAASQTAQVLGGAGAIGDCVHTLLIIPATTSPGAVALLDGGTSMTVFAGGTLSVGSLAPIAIRLDATAKNGPWKVTTGANVSCIATGKFTQ